MTGHEGPGEVGDKVGNTAEFEWQKYADRMGVAKPIRGTQDWNAEHDAFVAGYRAAVTRLSKNDVKVTGR